MIRRFRARPIPEKVIMIALLVVFAALSTWLIIRIRRQPPKVHDFDSCVAANNPVIETYPEQCSHNGRSYFKPGQAPYDPKNDLQQ